MPVPKASPAIVKSFPTALFEDNGAGLRKELNSAVPTIPTAAGNTDLYFLAPEDGSFHSIDISFNEALAASDTNYASFSLVNLGQSGTGTTEMLTPKNTKVTGGTAIVAGSRYSLVASTIKGATTVLAGDRLRFRVTGTGTLPNTLTLGAMVLRFNP